MPIPVQVSRSRAALAIKAAIVAGILAFGLFALMRGHDLHALIHHATATLRAAGIAPFFICMALLPALGVPLSLFTLTAGSAFGPSVGMPIVTLLALLSLTVNMTVAYALARYALKPLAVRVVARWGYNMPAVSATGVNDLIVLLRVAPGLPFPVQNYLLGLAQVPFGRYLALSCLTAFPLSVAFIFFGEALLQGRGRLAVVFLLLLLALIAAARLIRGRLADHRQPG